MARITGRALSLEVATDEWAGEITSYQLTSSDISDPTFQQVTDGDADWKLTLVVQQDMAADSAYRYLWDHSGESGVAVTLAPYGNAVATAAQPHVPLTCTLPRKPSLGGAATYDGKPLPVTVEVTVDTVGAWVTA